MIMILVVNLFNHKIILNLHIIIRNSSQRHPNFFPLKYFKSSDRTTVLGPTKVAFNAQTMFT